MWTLSGGSNLRRPDATLRFWRALVLSLGCVAVAEALPVFFVLASVAAIARLLVPKERFMNDAQAPPNGSGQVIQSAGYFRDQAALCLEIARHINDPGAVEKLHASAARHLGKAEDVEKRNTEERSSVDLSSLVDPVISPEPVKSVPKPSPEGTREFWTHVIR
jgi:hypothetical protein